MEAAVRVACRWCGFFSKPGSACDVCGSPLPSNAPKVPLEVARAAVFSRAEPISVVDEAPAREDPSPATAWERLLDVIGEPEDFVPPRPRVVIDLEEADQGDQAFADEALFEDGTDPRVDPVVDAYLDELATETVVSGGMPDGGVGEPAVDAEPAPWPEFIEFDASDGVGGAPFGAEWHPRLARPAPAWSSPVVPLRVLPVERVEPLIPAWSAGEPPRLRTAPRTRPEPGWSNAGAPVLVRTAQLWLPAWANGKAPVLARPVVTPEAQPWPAWGLASVPVRTQPAPPIQPVPAWGTATMPVLVRPLPVQPAPAWASGRMPVRAARVDPHVIPAWASADVPRRSRTAPMLVLPAWSDAAAPGRVPTPSRPGPQPPDASASLSRVQVGEELAALVTSESDGDVPLPVRALPQAGAEPAPAGRRLGFLRRGVRDSVASPPAVTPPRPARPKTVEQSTAHVESVSPPPESGGRNTADGPPSSEEAPAPSAAGGKTCSRCGRLSDRALCEACRDALQELHALSLG